MLPHEPTIDFPFEEHLRFGPDDDGAHAPSPNRDWTETTWWSFNVPERALAGWLYVQMRPNLGTASGGAFVYDPDAWLPWELPYFGFTRFQAIPDPLDLRDAQFPNGVSVRCLEPGTRYELGYHFRDHTDFTADLHFAGIIPPVPHLEGAPPFTGSSHFDQPGRVTGTLQLRGERIDVDCISVRDRSWGRRPELLGRMPRLSYAFGSASSDDAFLAFCAPDEPDAEVEHLTSGYLFRDNRVRRLVSATRRTTRDPVTGGVSRIELHGTDSDGRTLDVVGEARSRMFIPGHSVTINTFIEWSGHGLRSWGEDQDVWSTAEFADRVREARASQ
jgi:hypothetical protein